MLLADLSASQILKCLSESGINLDLGIATFNVKSPVQSVAKTLAFLYRDYEVKPKDAFVDFYIEVRPVKSLRRWLRPQVEFICDQHSPFLPLPKAQAYPLLEWGMNWCIASHYHQYLLVHAAVLVRDGKAIIFPAPPGSGKSTLTSYLAHNGWRLFSDEMAIIDLDTQQVVSFIRPICVKNDAIDIVADWFPDAAISVVSRDTKKGDVAHVRPPAESTSNLVNRADIYGVVFPEYTRDTCLDIYQVDKCSAYFSLVQNGFNPNVLGRDAFKALTRIIDRAYCCEVQYADMEALESFLTDVISGNVSEGSASGVISAG